MLFSNTVLAAYFTDDKRASIDPNITIASTYAYLLGGFFVGFGTKLGNGCTVREQYNMSTIYIISSLGFSRLNFLLDTQTGHGICGMARLSRRSFTSVAIFMLTAFAVANIVAPGNKAFSKGTEFLRTEHPPELFHRWIGFGVTAPFLLAAAFSLYRLVKAFRTIKAETHEKDSSVTMKDESSNLSNNDFDGYTIEVEKKYTPDRRQPNRNERVLIEDGIGKLKAGFFGALVFATGLAISGMVLPSKVLGFLNLTLIANGTWDLTLLTVMGGGAIVSFISYQFVDGFGVIANSYVLKCPRRSSSFSVPTNKKIDFQLIAGAFCFGIGWGVAGICPGPGLFLAASGAKPLIFYWWPTFVVGSFIAKKLKEQ